MVRRKQVIVCLAIFFVVFLFLFSNNMDEDKSSSLTYEEPLSEEDGYKIETGKVINKNSGVTIKGEEKYVRLIITLTEKKTDKIITNKYRANKILSMFYYNEVPLTKSMSEEERKKSGYMSVNNSFVFDTSHGGTGKYYYNYNGIMREKETATLFTGLLVYTDWNEKDIKEIGEFEVKVDVQAVSANKYKNLDEAVKDMDAMKN